MHDDPIAEAHAPSRRTALKALIAAGLAWPVLSDGAVATLVAAQRTGQPTTLVFLTPAQYATVDALTEAIIPADAHSPGARAARVADYVDLLVKESPADVQATWTDGLTAFDAECRTRFTRTFDKASPANQAALLTEISKNEMTPTTPLELFFRLAKDATIRGYYTSEIGIQKEIQYKGNQLLVEFVGCTHPEHGYVPPARG